MRLRFLTGLPHQMLTVGLNARCSGLDPARIRQRAVRYRRHGEHTRKGCSRVRLRRANAIRGHGARLQLGWAMLGQARRLEHALSTRSGIALGSG